MRTRKLVMAVALACSAMVSALSGAADKAADKAAAGNSYPNRPVRWIVAYPPAGTTDILARVMSQWLTQRTGQQFVVDNRPGGGNNIGTEIAIKSPPDGYTLYLVNPANAINASLYQKLPFNFLRDLTPVAGIVRVPNVMEITRSMPVKSVPEFIAYAKKNPGKVNMASSGSGTSVHLSGELFKAMTGIEMQHVPYKGAAPALIELIAGQVHVLFDNLPSSIGHIKAGDIRALAVTTSKRSAAWPDVPTVAESVPGYEASAWFGMAVPKGTPPAIVEKLNREVNAALADPGMKAKLADLGGDPIPGTPEAFWKLHAMETEKWAKVVKVSGAKVE
jgi:tripartite-type tricarboxylate transporter receptor subunit TctC